MKISDLEKLLSTLPDDTEVYFDLADTGESLKLYQLETTVSVSMERGDLSTPSTVVVVSFTYDS
jgi:hypothetical protein